MSNLFEGGNVFKDKTGLPLTQRINQADIPGTVKWLEQVTGLDLSQDQAPDTGYPLKWLGSTGKTPSSGDLDLAVDVNEITKPQLKARLEQYVKGEAQEPKEYVRLTGEAVHFKTPILGDANNGFVQTDFMFMPDLNWGVFFLSGGQGSVYKGMFRNVLMSSLAKALGLKISAKGLFSRADDKLISMDPDMAAQYLLGRNKTRADLKNVETIYANLANDPDRDAKLKDFREYLAKENTPEPKTAVAENDAGFLAKLRDRIVNQGMLPLIEAEKSANPYHIYEADAPGVGGKAKGIEHLEDLVFRKATAGIQDALEIVRHAAESPAKTTTVKWDGKPAIIFGRKPETGEFVLTDGSGFEAKGYDGLATSIEHLAQFMNMRSGDRTELIRLYATLWPKLEAALPANFRGYVKGDLLYMDTPPDVAGNYVFQPNTVEYRIPARSTLGKRISASNIGIAMHSMYADPGSPREPLSRVNFNAVPGLLLIEPIGGKEIVPNEKLIAQIKSLAKGKGQAINTLFNPAELRANQITDLAKLCVDYINARIGTGNFDNLLGGFGSWLQTKVTPRKYANIIEYLQSPTSNKDGLVAAFTAFVLLHELKLDILRQLDLKDPGHEGWVMATPAGYAKAVNRFDFTARNRARNNPDQA